MTLEVVYDAADTVTITLASLATSATWVAGREGVFLDNGVDKFVDRHISGTITVGTTPTADTQIRIYAIAALDETPTWPDSFGGDDTAETWTNIGVRDSAAKLIHVIRVPAATSNVGYDFAGISIARYFGHVPEHLSLFVTHNTGVNLNATGGNHNIKSIGIKYADV